MLRAAFVSAVCLVVFFSSAAWAGPVYFVVAERPDNPAVHHDSYLLPLTRAADIAHARLLLEQGPENVDDPIVGAYIAKGSDGINRNILAEGEPLWSWHIESFDTFAGGSIEIVDSWPTYI